MNRRASSSHNRKLSEAKSSLEGNISVIQLRLIPLYNNLWGDVPLLKADL